MNRLTNAKEWVLNVKKKDSYANWVKKTLPWIKSDVFRKLIGFFYLHYYDQEELIFDAIGRLKNTTPSTNNPVHEVLNLIFQGNNDRALKILFYSKEFNLNKNPEVACYVFDLCELLFRFGRFSDLGYGAYVPHICGVKKEQILSKFFLPPNIESFCLIDSRNEFEQILRTEISKIYKENIAYYYMRHSFVTAIAHLISFERSIDNLKIRIPCFYNKLKEHWSSKLLPVGLASYSVLLLEKYLEDNPHCLIDAVRFY